MCQSNTKTIAGPTLRSPFKLVDEPALTASEFLLERANFYVKNGKADHPFLIDSITSESYTFNDFIRLSSNAANWFYASGMEKGDTVIYLPVNFSKMYFIFCGVWQANGVVRSSYPEDTAETLLERVQESKAKWIYCEGTQAEQVLGVAAQCDWPIQVIVNGRAENCIALDDVLNFDGKVSPTLEVTADDAALILCTSGTTGKSKGAVRTHRSVVNIYRVHSTFPWGDRSLFLCKGTHISGTFVGLGNLAAGKTIILVCRLDLLDFFRGIHEYKPDLIHTFPTFLAALVRHADRDKYDLSSINRIITGGTGLSAPTADMIRTALPHVQHIINVYGLTESLYTIATVRYSRDGKCDIFDAPSGSAGVVSPGREIQIRDPESGRVLGPGQKGEICIKSPDMFSRYVNNPQATEDAFTEDGFFKTGDIGSYDENECITVHGRAKEVFKWYNNHVSPAHIDEVICQHPAVSEVCTVGVMSEDGVNEFPRAFVTLKAGCERFTTVADITEFAHGKLADYMHLRGGLYIVPELPRGPTGKVTRSLVGQLKVEGRG